MIDRNSEGGPQKTETPYDYLNRTMGEHHLRLISCEMLSGRKVEWIDPVGCGCVDCLTGTTFPAVDDAQYEIAQVLGVSR